MLFLPALALTCERCLTYDYALTGCNLLVGVREVASRYSKQDSSKGSVL